MYKRQVLYRQDLKVYNVIKGLCNERHSQLYYLNNGTTEIKKQDINGTVMSVKNDLYEYDNIVLPLVGEYQIKNCETALLAAYALKKEGVILSDENILNGIKNVKWNGRMEICKKEPMVIIDGAHNADVINMIVKSIKKYFSDKIIVLLMGVLGDKDYEKMAAQIVPLAETTVITQPDSSRALSVEGFKKTVEKYCDNVYGFENIEEAYSFALDLTGKDDVLICAGSLYLIGRLRQIIVGGNKIVQL